MSAGTVRKIKRNKELHSNGLCGNHPAEAVVFGKKYCARCQDNQRKNRKKIQDSGICSRCRKYPLKTKTACQKCLWELSEGKVRRDFGLTPEDYAWMEYRQNRGCKLCLRPCPSGNALAVDHDHATGRVRGLLCIECNRIVGFIEQFGALARINEYLR